MEEEITIQELTKTIERASTDFEKSNTDLKRKYLIWNIIAFNTIASAVSVNKGTFGTGYPFYALDKNLNGKLPIIQEQIRYNRELIKDGSQIRKSIWLCKPCLDKNYDNMPDLKKICKPCPNVNNKLKPRKIINRIQDMDMWLICKDGAINEAQKEFSYLLEKFNMHSSDENPIKTMEDMVKIAEMLKSGECPNVFLPIDTHIIEYSEIKSLIEQVPEVIKTAKKEEQIPFLPIHPKSYRKQWQYDDEAYNFIYDYLSAFSEFNVPEDLQDSINKSRVRIAKENEPTELFEVLLQSATEPNFRRFQSMELEENFIKRIEGWKPIKEKKGQNVSVEER